MIIFSIDPTWAGGFFAFYIGFSAFLGIVIYLCLTDPQRIRAEFRDLFRPISKKSAAICAAITMLPLCLYGYWDCWKYYYSLSIKDNGLVVKYLFPTREYVLPDIGRIKVITETEPRKGMVYRIKLVIEEHSFVSQQMTLKEYEANHLALTQVIQKRTGLRDAEE